MRAMVAVGWCCIAFHIWAQTPVLQWARTFTMGNGNTCAPIDAHADRMGKILVAGQVSGTAAIGTSTIGRKGNSGGWLACIQPDGSLAWSGTFEADSGKAGALPMLVTHDRQGNAFVCGPFSDTVDIDPGQPVYTLATSNGNPLISETFLVKLNVLGQLVWAVQFQRDVSVHKITADSSGNILLAGQGYNSCDLDPGSGIYVPTVNNGYFVVKLDANGQFKWAACAERCGGAIHALSTDGLGRVNVGGYAFGWNVPGNIAPAPAVFNCSVQAGYIVRLDSNGAFLDAALLPGGILISSIETDRYQNRLVGGVFYGYWPNIDLDPGPGAVPVNSLATGFVEKLDASGNLLWARGIYTPPAYPHYQGYLVKIQSDQNGNAWVCADGKNGMVFESAAGSASIQPAFNGLFYGLAHYDPAGNVLWTGSVGSILAQWLWFETAMPFAALKNGDIYLSGFFNGPCELEPVSGSYTIAPNGAYTNIFIEKISVCRNTSQLVLSATAGTVCAGQSLQLIASGASEYEWNPALPHTPVVTVSPTLNTIYEVAGYDTLGCMNTQSIAVVVDGCVNTSEEALTGTGVFPNPANTAVQVNCQLPGVFRLTDLWGRTVLTMDLENTATTVDLLSLGEGAYHWETFNAAGSARGKLVIVR